MGMGGGGGGSSSPGSFVWYVGRQAGLSPCQYLQSHSAPVSLREKTAFRSSKPSTHAMLKSPGQAWFQAPGLPLDARPPCLCMASLQV